MCYKVLCASLLALCLQGTVWSEQLSGSQTRGQGTNGQLKSNPLVMPRSGTIVGVTCNGDGFWIENNNGRVQRFNRGGGNGTILGAGTYRAYPNLLARQNRADLSIDIQLSKKAGAPTGSGRGEGRRGSGAQR